MTLLSLRGVVKKYHALRPLRIQELTMGSGQLVSLLGLDAQAAEMLVGLVTGAIVPDEGEVQLFGKPTSKIADSEAWLALLDGVGIVTDRAVLIEQFSVLQNVTLPFTLQVDPIGAEFRPAAEALARETGLADDLWDVPVARAGAEAMMRVRLARALALSPRLLLAEHPSATLPRDVVKKCATDLARIAHARELAVLVLTGDELFAAALGGDTLVHDGASGALRRRGLLRRLFG